jgi:hypothetical protein
MKTQLKMSKEEIVKDASCTSLVIQENTEFLLANAKDSYNEVVELIDDSWNFTLPFIKKETWKDYYAKYSMIYFGTHVLSPLSFAIRIDLQVGNIPACFFELRMMLESMVKCYWADTQYKEQELSWIRC